MLWQRLEPQTFQSLDKHSTTELPCHPRNYLTFHSSFKAFFGAIVAFTLNASSYYIRLDTEVFDSFIFCTKCKRRIFKIMTPTQLNVKTYQGWTLVSFYPKLSVVCSFDVCLAESGRRVQSFDLLTRQRLDHSQRPSTTAVHLRIESKTWFYQRYWPETFYGFLLYRNSLIKLARENTTPCLWLATRII